MVLPFCPGVEGVCRTVRFSTSLVEALRSICIFAGQV